MSPTFGEPVSVSEPAAPSGGGGGGDTEGFIKYRALYDYASDNADDLAFKAGDTIIVNPDQPHEPGWLGGELNGQVGWFPEAYAEPASNPPVKAEKPAAVTEAKESNQYVALFPYNSEEPGDLVFEAGEQIEVYKKENEWWTGKIGDRSGVFPYNYVEPAAAGIPTGDDPVGVPVPTGGNASETNGDEAEPIYSEPVAETAEDKPDVKPEKETGVDEIPENGKAEIPENGKAEIPETGNDRKNSE